MDPEVQIRIIEFMEKHVVSSLVPLIVGLVGIAVAHRFAIRRSREERYEKLALEIAAHMSEATDVLFRIPMDVAEIYEGGIHQGKNSSSVERIRRKASDRILLAKDAARIASSKLRLLGMNKLHEELYRVVRGLTDVELEVWGFVDGNSHDSYKRMKVSLSKALQDIENIHSRLASDFFDKIDKPQKARRWSWRSLVEVFPSRTQRKQSSVEPDRTSSKQGRSRESNQA